MAKQISLVEAIFEVLVGILAHFWAHLEVSFGVLASIWAHLMGTRGVHFGIKFGRFVMHVWSFVG